jgi:hypothetical protein
VEVTFGGSDLTSSKSPLPIQKKKKKKKEIVLAEIKQSRSFKTWLIEDELLHELLKLA